MTRSELIETIHANNQDIRDQTKEIIARMDAIANQIRQEMNTNIHQLRQEMKSDRKWLIGLFLTAIIAMPALFKFFELLLLHIAK